MLSVGLSTKLDLTLKTSLPNMFALNYEDLTFMMINHILMVLRLKSWDFASMLGLANMSGIEIGDL